MISIKKLLAETLIGKQVHYKCTCLFPIDVVGMIVSYKIENNEIVWKLLTNDKKMIDIGENSPNAFLEII